MKAKLRQYRQAPRKVRLVADFVRGKEVTKVLDALLYINKRAARPLRKLILSAAANAKETKGLSTDELLIKEVRVDKGITYKRFRARARGRAAAIHKHTSNILIILRTKEAPQPNQPKADLAQKQKKSAKPSSEVKKETAPVSHTSIQMGAKASRGGKKKASAAKTSKAGSIDQSKTGLGEK